ncbi:MAG: hypothetical protein IJC29_03100 [Clostridia bacterium]|nr:hypothetical protein [Clostridia bacterium]
MELSTPRANGALGYLIVEASTAENALPIPGALVTVTSPPGTGSTALSVETDISGRTERLVLGTVDRALSEVPGNVHPYTTYDITVVAEGYYPFYAREVPIFSGVTTLQPAALIALSSFESERVFPRNNTDVTNTEPFGN